MTRARPPGDAAWLALALGGLLIATRAVPPDALDAAGVPFEWRAVLLMAGATLVWAFLADAGSRAGVKGWAWPLLPLALGLLIPALLTAGRAALPELGRAGSVILFGLLQGTWYAGAALAIHVAARAAGARTQGLAPWLVALPVLAAVVNPLTLVMLLDSSSPGRGVYQNVLALAPVALALALLLVVHARAGTPRLAFALAGVLAGALAAGAAARAVLLASVIEGVSGSITEWNLAFSLTRIALVLAYAGVMLASIAVAVPPRNALTGENAPSATTQRL